MLAVNGFEIRKGWLDPPAQAAMAADVARVAAVAPFFAPLTPWGKPMSVAIPPNRMVSSKAITT